MFRWTCYVTAVIAVSAVLFMLNDLRVTAKSDTREIKGHVLEIVPKVKLMAESMAEVASDVKEIRTLAGVTGERDRSFVVYANSLLQFIESAGPEARIGQGEAMKKSETPADWVAGTRKEALYLVFREKSREAILRRLCQTAPPLRSDFFIQLPGQKPIKLEEWVRANHPESQALSK